MAEHQPATDIEFTDGGADSVTQAKLVRALAISRQRVKARQLVIDDLRAKEAALRRELELLAQGMAWARDHAFHDPLTGLPNRSVLLDRFKQAVAQGKRHDRRVALLFLDLDGFKSVNDTLGHAAGDAILQQVAARLTACTRAADTVCRYGGDEFVVLLPEFEAPDCATAAAEKIRLQLATPYIVDGANVPVTASIGMAIYPVDGVNYSDLMRLSDLAMYRNKAGAAASLRSVAR
jgi:diguanylate cyclase (GGDEF)-like protein